MSTREPGTTLMNLIADLNRVVTEHRELVQKAQALAKYHAAVQSLEPQFPGLMEAVRRALSTSDPSTDQQ